MAYKILKFELCSLKKTNEQSTIKHFQKCHHIANCENNFSVLHMCLSIMFSHATAKLQG